MIEAVLPLVVSDHNSIGYRDPEGRTALKYRLRYIDTESWQHMGFSGSVIEHYRTSHQPQPKEPVCVVQQRRR